MPYPIFIPILNNAYYSGGSIQETLFMLGISLFLLGVIIYLPFLVRNKDTKIDIIFKGLASIIAGIGGILFVIGLIMFILELIGDLFL